MNPNMGSEVVHPEGEEKLSFPTPGGNVRLSMTGDALTPFGGFVPWAAFSEHIGVVKSLAKDCPVERTSPNAAPVYDILQTFMLTALADGRRFSHVERMREDPTIPEIFGMESVVSSDTVRRFFESVNPAMGAEWIARHVQPMWGALPANPILDWDSTVMTKYGEQEGAEIGYNPTKPGRPSFHPLLAVVAKTRLCPSYHFRAGDTVTSTNWAEAMEDAQRWLGPTKVWLNRGDIGLGNESVISWHEQAPNRPHFLFKLKITANVRRAIAGITEESWTSGEKTGMSQVAEGPIRLIGWSRERRVIFTRTAQGPIPVGPQSEFWEQHKHEFAAYVTNLPMNYGPREIEFLYRGRADCENVLDELKNQWGFNGFCAKSRSTTELAARLTLIVYNLWVLFVRFIVPKKHTEAKKGRRWFLIIAGRLVESGRQKELQISVTGGWAQELKDGYLRLREWIRTTAPQLKYALDASPETHASSSPAPA